MADDVRLSESEANNLALFIKAIHEFLVPVIKDLTKKSSDTNDNATDFLSVAKEHEAAYAAILPPLLVQYGFEDVKCMLAGEGIPQWTKPLLPPTGTRSVVEDAFLAYIAKEVMELHKSHTAYLTDDDQQQPIVSSSSMLTADRMKLLLQNDEDLSTLANDVGYWVSPELGAHLHGPPCVVVKSEPDEDTLKKLEIACRTGTADEVLSLLSHIGYVPYEKPIIPGCEAVNKRLPQVPSRVAPPNFEARSRAGTTDHNTNNDDDDDDYYNSSVVVKGDRPIPMLVVSCHCGNYEVSSLLVQRFGAYVMSHNENTEDKYTPLYSSVLTNPDASIVELLLNHGAWPWIDVPVRYRDMYGWTVQMHSLLKLAIRNGIGIDIVKLLLDHGAMSKLHGEEEKVGVLESSAKVGRLDVMIILIDEHGIPVDQPLPEVDRNDLFDNSEQRVYTPLMGAVANKQSAAAELLLQRGANPNLLFPSVTAVTQYNTPLRIASQRGDGETIRILLQHGASWSTKSDIFLWGEGRDPTHMGQVELQDALVGYGSADEGRVEAIRALLEGGAQVSPFLAQLAQGQTEHVPHEWEGIGGEARQHISELLCEAAAPKAEP